MPRSWHQLLSSTGTRSPRRPGIARRLLARFRRSQDGATAVEFGILALPFLFLMFAILEIAMVFWSTQILETAVANAARQIYTGQFQNDPANAVKVPEDYAKVGAKFKKAVCDNVTAVFNCTAAVSVDIRPFSYPGGTPPSAVTNRVFDTSGFGYQAIGPNQIALVTAAMEYSTLVRMLSSSTGTLSNGNRVIIATATFRTEPYSTN